MGTELVIFKTDAAKSACKRWKRSAPIFMRMALTIVMSLSGQKFWQMRDIHLNR